MATATEEPTTILGYLIIGAKVSSPFVFIGSTNLESTNCSVVIMLRFRLCSIFINPYGIPPRIAFGLNNSKNSLLKKIVRSFSSFFPHPPTVFVRFITFDSFGLCAIFCFRRSKIGGNQKKEERGFRA
jgi:hypothetical protein